MSNIFATLCALVLSFQVIAMHNQAKPSVLDTYNASKKSKRPIITRLSFEELKYDIKKSFWFLDWKEGHGAKRRLPFAIHQANLFEDVEASLKSLSRCVLHTEYHKEFEGSIFGFDKSTDYIVSHIAMPTRTVYGDFFTLSFVDPKNAVEGVQFQVSCLGMKATETTLEDISKQFSSSIEFSF